MEVLNGPVMAASAKACHAKGCKKYTCFYHIFGNQMKISQNILEIYPADIL